MAILLGTIAAGIRLFVIWGYLPRLFDTENMRAGFTLAAKGVMSDPFIIPTGPTAHVAPLYPALIALGTWLSGSQEVGLLLARSSIAVAFGVFVALLPTMAEWTGFRRSAGWIAAIVFLFPTPPIFMWIEVSGQHEAITTALLFAFAVAATLGSMRSGALGTVRAALLGVAWAAAAYSSPVVAPPIAALLAGAWLFRLAERRRIVRFGSVLLAAFVLCVTPWLVRNARTVGGFAFIRDNFWLEIYVSNFEDAWPDMRENIGTTMQRHPYFNREEAEKVKRIGEQKYNAARGAEARAWIRAHPARFVRLTLKRVQFFFAPRLGLSFHPLFFVPLLVLSAVGLTLSFVRRESVVIVLAGVILAYAAPHFLVQASPRYSYPVLWILVFVSSSVVLEAWERLARRARASRPEVAVA